MPVARSLPRNARRTDNEREVFRRLAKDHGIDRVIASDRLHGLKRQTGRGGADNLLFDLTGNVFDPVTLQWIGTLTEGGGGRD